MKLQTAKKIDNHRNGEMRLKTDGKSSVLRVCRVRLGMNQAELAKKAAIDESMVSLMECGKRSPSSRVAFRIAKVLGMKVDDLWELR